MSVTKQVVLKQIQHKTFNAFLKALCQNLYTYSSCSTFLSRAYSRSMRRSFLYKSSSFCRVTHVSDIVLLESVKGKNRDLMKQNSVSYSNVMSNDIRFLHDTICIIATEKSCCETLI